MKIRELLDECIKAGREQGYEGSDDEYQFTAEDLEFVTDSLGYKPTREEWASEGLKWVGEAHISFASQVGIEKGVRI